MIEIIEGQRVQTPSDGKVLIEKEGNISFSKYVVLGCEAEPWIEIDEATAIENEQKEIDLILNNNQLML